MGAEKGLSVIAGILTLIATYILVWYTTAGGEYAYGIGGILGFLGLLTDFTNWVTYVVIVIDVLLLISFLLQFIGAKSRATAIIGAIMPLVIGIFIILNTFGLDVIGFMNFLSVFETSFTIVPGIIPFDYALPTRPESIGTYVLLLGGLLSLISGFISRSIYY